MKKVMFVCLGNICRSPMAEAIFRHLVKEAGKEAEYFIDSSGTSAYHIGEESDPRMQMTAEKHGVEMCHLGQEFEKKHFAEFDLIVAMDQSNFNNIIRLTQNDKDRQKVKLMRDYDQQNESLAVPDPYYGGKDGFEEVFRILEKSCKGLLKQTE